MTKGTRAVFLAILAATGCGEEGATRVLVYLTADATVTDQAAELEVRVLDRSGSPVGVPARLRLVAEPAADDEAALPFGLTVTPRDGDATTTFVVEGQIFDATGAPLVSQRAVGEYVANEVMELQLLFDADCVGIDCTSPQSCQAGSCVEPCVIPTPLGVLDDRRSPPVSCPDTRPCPDTEAPSCTPEGHLHTCQDGVHVNTPCPGSCVDGAPAVCM